MDTKKRILFIRHLDSSFVRSDLGLLSSDFDLLDFRFRHNKGLMILPELVRQGFFLLRKLPHSQGVFIWFADFHAVIPAFLCRLFRKKCIIVIGGVDASYLPEYQYGTKTKLLGKISLKLSTKLATNLLPVSVFTQNNLLNNAGIKLQAKSKVVYNCFDSSLEPPETAKRKKAVITVCLANKIKTIFIKGVDFYIELAKVMPQYSFTIVGLSDEAFEWAEHRGSSNLQLIKPVDHRTLLKLMTQNKVICQFSRHEAFGLALLEGISAGCFPVGYNYGGTGEIIANSLACGIDKLEIAEAIHAIEYGMKADDEVIKSVQAQIIPRFACNKRKQDLISVLKAES